MTTARRPRPPRRRVPSNGQSGITLALDSIAALRRDSADRFDRMDRRFDAMDRRFDGVDAKLDQILAHLKLT